jgi:transcriptional regulator with XRE-family HTH domain
MTEEVIKDIGDRIYALRKEGRLSIKRLSEISGVSPAGIHKIENNHMIPTITVLMKIAKALNKTVSYFVDEEKPFRDLELVRRKDRKKLYSSRVHVWMENLAGNMEDGLLTGIFCIVNPKGNSGKTKMSHRGEEMILVLDNVIEFNIRNKVHRLLKGDCLHFRSELPHSWKNPSGRKTKALWVFAPAPFLL